ncbi:MAG: SDR family oxidoreductase [Verrucomicrobia bacterium]|nr:SDR family oxidoreductase [Verrucomicrobiota bacterium]
MILVTGATGNIGSELVKLLVAKGLPVRVISRDEKKVSQLDPGVERVIGDRHDPSIVRKAAQGADKVFMLAMVFDATHQGDRVLVEAAKEAGAGQIVMISSASIQREGNAIGRLHREKEQLVESSGIPWTLLRPGGFMSNSILWWAESIKSQSKVFNPAGNGKTAPISPYDIAAVAAVALTSSGHEGKAYDLTGGELLSTPEQVEIISKVIGKPIECVDIPVDVAAERMIASGVPEALVKSLADLWAEIRKEGSTFQTNEVERLTGQPAQTFETWCREHRSAFV